MRRRSLPFESITSDDYFKKTVEFNLWLRKERDITFDTLTSKESRSLFDVFVKRWNRGSLEGNYYTGLSSEARPSSFTKHKWGFVDHLSSKDTLALESTKDSVQIATQSLSSKTTQEAKMSGAADSGRGSSGINVVGWSAAGDRLREHQDREREKMEEFKRSIGLQPGQRIQMAPRAAP